MSLKYLYISVRDVKGLVLFRLFRRKKPQRSGARSSPARRERPNKNGIAF